MHFVLLALSVTCLPRLNIKTERSTDTSLLTATLLNERLRTSGLFFHSFDEGTGLLTKRDTDYSKGCPENGLNAPPWCPSASAIARRSVRFTFLSDSYSTHIWPGPGLVFDINRMTSNATDILCAFTEDPFSTLRDANGCGKYRGPWCDGSKCHEGVAPVNMTFTRNELGCVQLSHAGQGKSSLRIDTDVHQPSVHYKNYFQNNYFIPPTSTNFSLFKEKDRSQFGVYQEVLLREWSRSALERVPLVAFYSISDQHEMLVRSLSSSLLRATGLFRPALKLRNTASHPPRFEALQPSALHETMPSQVSLEGALWPLKLRPCCTGSELPCELV